MKHCGTNSRSKDPTRRNNIIFLAVFHWKKRRRVILSNIVDYHQQTRLSRHLYRLTLALVDRLSVLFTMRLSLPAFLPLLSHVFRRPSNTSTTTSSSKRTIMASSSSSSSAKFENPQIVAKPINDYALQVGFAETDVARELRLVTAQHSRSIMMGDPIEAAFFKVLLPAIGARKIIEVGVYTGYTTLVMAQAIQSTAAGDDNDGKEPKIIALDINDEFVSIGKPYWEKAGVKDTIIDLRLGPAAESLQAILDQEDDQAGTFDFAFIDADKTNYKVYYELLLKLIRKNGLIAIDNVLWSGKVLDPAQYENDADTAALREISEYVKADDRVEFVLLPFADGVTLVRKK